MKNILSRFGILSEFIAYLWKKKHIILLLTLIFLILFGALIFFLQSQVAPTPFIYTLF